jgi:hypothetical protein
MLDDDHWQVCIHQSPFPSNSHTFRQRRFPYASNPPLLRPTHGIEFGVETTVPITGNLGLPHRDRSQVQPRPAGGEDDLHSRYSFRRELLTGLIKGCHCARNVIAGSVRGEEVPVLLALAICVREVGDQWLSSERRGYVSS